MKKTILFFIILLSVKIFAQTKVSALRDAAGLGNNSLIAIVENGVSKKLNTDVLLSPLGKRIDSLRAKPLYKVLTAIGNAVTLNFDSAAVVKITTAGNTFLNFSASLPTGSTGLILLTQSAAGNDNFSYNGSPLNIARISNKTTLLGFVKNETGYIFSSDTTGFFIAETGMISALGNSFDQY